MDKDTAEFILQSIEKISLAILMADYDGQEMGEIYQRAGIHLADFIDRDEE